MGVNVIKLNKNSFHTPIKIGENMDLSFLNTTLKNTTVKKPSSGTLSGHAAGEPFDKHVETELKKRIQNVYRQYEYLNELYRNNPSCVDVQSRYSLIPKKSVQFLLNRGKDATKNWSISNLFEEKQNDTADILITENGIYNIIDVKTRNTDKSAQQPNIISALKLAEMCKIMIETSDFSGLDIIYIGIDWKLKGDNLVCEDIHIRNLFKSNPANLYINWSAALQIQFHVHDLDQTYSGSKEDWVREYLQSFVDRAKTRIEYMKKEWVDIYEPLIIKKP